jgi:hypothetical protein
MSPVAAPHEVQNGVPSGMSALHLGHFIVMRSRNKD